MSDYISPEEFAATFSIHRETVYRMLRAKKLPALKIGRQWRINRSNAYALSDTCKKEAH